MAIGIEKHICDYCKGKIPPKRWPFQIGKLKKRAFCSKDCLDKFEREILPIGVPILRGRNSVLTGSISELLVCVDLLCKGFYVFRSVSPSAPCDLIIIHENKTAKIEVKTTYSKSGGGFIKFEEEMDKSKFDILALVYGSEVHYFPNIEDVLI
ncbi:hypothetical protein A2Z67_00040 [Candidatus Woesebacteria bacterium RBG_13_36_22]|uniref:MYM-type domain-containing protein n=1 Tax=Candidatus Woesebacteria bacterium RBG_13_36_22 TaxID=1802478 RepID=A0A1F7X6C5_9BACT|nr:MAG: hypothetical protein A2Z67_00040 [Candidatus Woesebacteria bacterium RBG_13_36_22]